MPHPSRPLFWVGITLCILAGTAGAIAEFVAGTRLDPLAEWLTGLMDDRYRYETAK
jgi:hypothetical protein